MLLPTLDTHVFPVLQLPLTEKYASYAVIRKLFVKFAQRVGMCYLKPKVASWRYQRGNRSLKQNLEGTTESGVVDANNVGKTIGGEEEEEDDVPEQIEDIIEILLNGLRDRDTIVRWSSAKGLGRITQRLPRELADDVIDSLFELFSENILSIPGSSEPDLSAVSDNTYHGACLAVAELTRRGLLLPVRLAQVVPWCVRALRFDQKRGAHSVGAHVRDAACYVCWSFARAYAPEVVAPHVERISINLVIVSVFDREVNVRRASSAAFQENVGRQGIFPHGIDIIQAADYFSVGNRVNAFLKVSLQIAKFEEYRYHLIDELCTSTANHWDKAMRILGAKALNALSHLDPRYMIEHVLPIMIPATTSSDMNTSHGALMAVGEICMSLYECRDGDADGYWVTRYHETVQNISAIISHFPPSMLTTFGSEHIREAACHLITCLSRSNWPVDMNTLTSWKAVIHTSLERREENVQEHAVGSFGAITRQYGVSGDEIRQCVATVEPSRNVSKFTRRGYALALGTVDYKAIPEWLDFVVEGLSRAAAVNEDNLINNAEVKRNAVLSLIQIVENLGFDFRTGAVVILCQAFFACPTFLLIIYNAFCSPFNLINLVTPKTTFFKIISTLLTGLNDYSIDQRGDVGSWVREASMRGLGVLVPLVAKLDLLVTPEDAFLSQATRLDVVAGLLKQSVERIDRTRSCAGRVLHDILYVTRSAEESQGKTEWLLEIPGRSVLEEVMPRYENLNWASPADVYPRMVRVLVVPEYRFDLLTGLISSAGGLTDACLIDYVSSLPVIVAGATASDPYSLSLTNIVQAIVSMFTPFFKQDRVTIPLLEVTGLLFETGTLNNIEDETIFLKMLELVKKEGLNTRDIRKLVATIRLLAGFAGLTGTKARVRALQQLLIYLVHPFPRIRVAAADQLYLYLSTLDDEVMNDGTMQAEEIVMATKWISPVEELKPIRNSLYPLLSIPPPVLRTPVKKQD
ncbi:hypothetical protein BC937DRAFT_86672 [Endogone sp. FLAS-F59071]|nr:hypothetical protein BC937DRAFT_86672 [Endogone sp. FLAS-F59071]|eukprot:RUS22812.1 hypothetical protein BC937DRAFT_86672 [Endogone sp. FLAS-F59071]